MATIVLCHGAWSGGWSWKHIRGPLSRAGHEFHATSYTGVGERRHLLSPQIDLDTHIEDILGLIRVEELTDIVLLGHSYGGMVATGVADRARDRVAEVIYLDAFVPEDGQALVDLIGPQQRDGFDARVAQGDGWRIAPNPVSDDTPPEARAWVQRHQGDMPVACFRQKLRLSGPITVPRHYIYATVKAGDDPFLQFRDRFRDADGWTCQDMDASHAPNVAAPDKLLPCLWKILDRA